MNALLCAFLFLRLGAPAPSSPQTPPTVPEVVVVGTIHKAHLTQPGYPVGLLERAIDAFGPDLVLVEIRVDPFARGEFEDGPFEMSAVVAWASARKIPVMPIDWWRKDEIGVEPQPDPTDMPAIEAEMGPVMAAMPWPPTFLQAHSSERARAILDGLSLRARYFGGNATWNRRQSWMNLLALKAISQKAPSRVMAFVGEEHRPELEQSLVAHGMHLRSALEIGIRIDPTVTTKHVDPEVIAVWKQGSARLAKQAETESEPMRTSLKSKAHYFALAAKVEGACCVDPKALDAPP